MIRSANALIAYLSTNVFAALLVGPIAPFEDVHTNLFADGWAGRAPLGCLKRLLLALEPNWHKQGHP